MTATLEQPKNGRTAIAASPPAQADDTRSIAPFASESNFAAAQRVARALGSASMVPKQYQGADNLPNVLIALELAARIGASPLMVMQSLYVVQGKPSWSSSFLIACVNQSQRFTPLRFVFEGKPGADDWGCRAVAKDKTDGEACVGCLITIKLAKAEGWYGKSGSKWQTMPEQMLMYRAAGFWARVYAPELSLGMLTREEVEDIQPAIADNRSAPADIDAVILAEQLKIESHPVVAPADTVADPAPEKESPFDEAAADQAAMGLQDAIADCMSEFASQKIGAELNKAKATLGEARYKGLLELLQTKNKELAAAKKK